jgi:amino acid transporter
MVLGMVQLARGKASTSFRKPLFVGSSTSPSSWSLALYSGLWAFDGWDQANFVGGEMSHPEKNIPRAIHSSMSLVMVTHLLSRPVVMTDFYITVVIFTGKCLVFRSPRRGR